MKMGLLVGENVQFPRIRNEIYGKLSANMPGDSEHRAFPTAD